MISFEEFRNEVITHASQRPKGIRYGQEIFNYIDEVYGVAREVQFLENIDCFYNDENTEPFIIASYKKLWEYNHNEASN